MFRAQWLSWREGYPEGDRPCTIPQQLRVGNKVRKAVEADLLSLMVAVAMTAARCTLTGYFQAGQRLAQSRTSGTIVEESERTAFCLN